jgi:hypothetical protein
MGITVSSRPERVDGAARPTRTRVRVASFRPARRDGSSAGTARQRGAVLPRRATAPTSGTTRAGSAGIAT